MGKPEEAELMPARPSRAPLHNVSSRDIDDAHRPRITRRAPLERASGGRTSAPRAFLKRSLLGAAAMAGAALGASLCLLVIVPGTPQEMARPSASRTAPGVVADQKPPDDLGHATLPPDDGPDDGKELELATAISTPPARDAPSPALTRGTAANEESAIKSSANAPRAPPRGAAPRQPAGHRRVLLQLSAYSDYSKARVAAERFEKSLSRRLDGAAITTTRASVRGKTVWRVVAGPIADRLRGERLCKSLRSTGQDCIVIVL